MKLAPLPLAGAAFDGRRWKCAATEIRHDDRVKASARARAASLALRRLVDTSVKAGLVLAVVAALALAISAVVGGAEGLIIATIAGPVLTIAIVNLIFEPFGRNAMAEDIRELLGREHRVIEAGLRDMLDGPSTAPATLIGTSSSVALLPWHPTQWAERDFRPLCELAQSRKLALRIFMPTPDDRTVVALADRLGVGPSILATDLADLPDELCQAWDAVGVHPASTLEVWTYPGLPAIGLLASEAAVAIDLGPAVRRGAFDASSQISVFEPGSPVAQSIEAQLTAVEREATRAGVRPIRTPQPRGGQPHPLASSEEEIADGQ